MSCQRGGAVSLASLAILWSATHVALDARQTSPPAHDVIVLSAPGDLPWTAGAAQGLEQAALTTARALQEIAGHWDAVYEAMRREEEPTDKEEPSAGAGSRWEE